MRLMRPVSTRPGPTSMNVSTPASAIGATAATQSTPVVRCSTSSRAAASRVAQRPRVGVGEQRRRRIAERHAGERSPHPVGGLGHQRGVGGDGHRQDDRLRAPSSLRDLGAGLDRRPLARHDDLAGRVAVRDAEHARPPPPAATSSGSRSSSRPMIAAIAPGRPSPDACIEPAAFTDEANPVGERDDPAATSAEYWPIEWPAANAGRGPRRRLAPALAQRREHTRSTWRAGRAGRCSVRSRSSAGPSTRGGVSGSPSDGIGIGEDRRGRGRRGGERLAHADATGTPGRGTRRRDGPWRRESACMRDTECRPDRAAYVRCCPVHERPSRPCLARGIRGRRTPPRQRVVAALPICGIAVDVPPRRLRGRRPPAERRASCRDRVAMGRALWRELVVGFAAQLGDLRLGFTQLAALYVLADGRTTTIADLADALHRSPSATSRLVDGLVRRAAPRAPAETEDRRQRTLWLTQRGQALLASSIGPAPTSSCPPSGPCRRPSAHSSRWASRHSRRTPSRDAAG